MDQPDTIDFREPRRQSEAFIIIECFSLMKKRRDAIGAMVIILLLQLPWQQYYLIAVGFLVILALLAFFVYLSYRNTTFTIQNNDSEFILNKGIFNKSKVFIQLNKITQVNINQHFVQRLLEVYSVEIETAGSVGSEACIKALDYKEAIALKQVLLKEVSSAREEISSSPGTAQRAKNIISIKPSQLILYAFTAAYAKSFVVLFTFLLTFYLNYFDSMDGYREKVQTVAIETWEKLSVWSLILISFVIVISFNVVRNIIVYYKMKIEPDNGVTGIRYGLFSRKNTLLQNHKIQTFRIQTNPLQRLLKIFKVDITQTSLDIDQDKKANITIAGLNEGQANALFNHIFKTVLPEKADNTIISNWRRFILPVVLFGIIPSLTISWLALHGYVSSIHVLLFIIYLLVFALLMKRYYSYYHLYISGPFIVKEKKVWQESYQYVPLDNVQSVIIEQFFWQKALNLGHITIRTAGDRVVFNYGHFEALQLLANFLLYQVEKGNRS